MLEEVDADDGGEDAYVTDDHILPAALGDSPKIKLLAVFVGNPKMDFNITELAEYAGLKRDTVYKYIDDLRGWGFVEETRKVGNSQMYSVNQDSEAAETFAKLEWELMSFLGEKEEAGELDEENAPLP